MMKSAQNGSVSNRVACRDVFVDDRRYRRTVEEGVRANRLGQASLPE